MKLFGAIKWQWAVVVLFVSVGAGVWWNSPDFSHQSIADEELWQPPTYNRLASAKQALSGLRASGLFGEAVSTTRATVNWRLSGIVQERDGTLFALVYAEPFAVIRVQEGDTLPDGSLVTMLSKSAVSIEQDKQTKTLELFKHAANAS